MTVPCCAEAVEAVAQSTKVARSSFIVFLSSGRTGDVDQHVCRQPAVDLSPFRQRPSIERRNGPPGPTDLSTRFVTEDLPFGIAQITALAASRGVDVPLHKAGLRLFDALYGRDFAAENNLLPRLDLSDPLLTAACQPLAQALDADHDVPQDGM